MNKEKVILVTGGARRIGAAIISCLHKAGFRIVLHYRESLEEAESLAARLNFARPDSVRLLWADLSDVGCLSDVVQRAISCWGRLDGLVNNASQFRPTPFGLVTPSQLQEMMATNLEAPFFLSQAAAEALQEASGAIVNIVDVYADRPLPGYPVYSVTKAALSALTRSLAVELSPSVRVNGVSPGAILWPEGDQQSPEQEQLLLKVPLKRCGEPEDIAQTVLFLLRDAPYVTGQILAVDGGRSLFI